MSSVWKLANEARAEEARWAALGVQLLQTGGDPQNCFERAALCRAERYDFTGTGEIISPLVQARNRERFPHVKSFQ